MLSFFRKHKNTPGHGKKICFLVSGRGSNFFAVADAVRKGRIGPGHLGTLISDNPRAGALKLAKNFGMQTAVVDYAAYRGRRSEFDRAVLEALVKSEADLVVAAGFLKILSEETIRHYQNRIINIHPSLLPSFPGLKAQEQALEYGVKVSGCTVHFVDAGLDSGPVIVQRTVAVTSADTPDSIRSRILVEEHKALPEAVDLFCQGRLKVDGRRVIIR